MLQSLNEAEFDGGAGSDRDVSWSLQSSSDASSESDSEIIRFLEAGWTLLFLHLLSFQVRLLAAFL